MSAMVENQSQRMAYTSTTPLTQRLQILPWGLIMSQSLTASPRVFKLVSLTLRREQLLGQCVERQVPGVYISFDFYMCMSVLVCIQAHMPLCADARG